LYAEVAALLEAGRPLMVAARVDRSREEPVLIAEAIEPLEELLPRLVESVHIHTSTVGLDKETVIKFRELLKRHPGRVKAWFHVRLADGSIAELALPHALAWSREIQAQLAAWFGREALRLRCRRWRPQRANGRQEDRAYHVA